MATVAQVTEAYRDVLLGPRHGAGVCGICLNLTGGYRRCYACAHGGRWLDVVVPISYSVAGEHLHHVLVTYKRGPEPVARELSRQLAAVLGRFLAGHEVCVAQALATSDSAVVTTVPSGDRARERAHPLDRVVGEFVDLTRDRFRTLLRRSERPATPHVFTPGRYEPTTTLRGENVLLIDDTWTTGANAQSAAAALKRAGAGAVAAVVIGRHLNRAWGANDARLNGLPRPFDWNRCVLCQGADPA
jgi:hypothetical protein